MFKIKIVVIGPCKIVNMEAGSCSKSGKTYLCNQLADATDASSGDYHPTQGVRILEFESGSISVGKRTSRVDVELWDCGGDLRFENCWQAIGNEANGIIFVYDSEQKTQAQDLEKYVNYFIQEQGFKNNQCLTFAHTRSSTKPKSVTRLSPAVSKLQTITINCDGDDDTLQTSFNLFLKQIVQRLKEDQEQEEDDIVGT